MNSFDSAKSVAVLQVRSSSSRLTGKAMLMLGDLPLFLLAAKRAMNNGQALIVATSTDSTDDCIVEACKKHSIKYFRGGLNNVLERFVLALSDYDETTVIFRITADNVFPDGNFLHQLGRELVGRSVQYITSNEVGSGFPIGVSVEATFLANLREALENSCDVYDLEHVTPYIRRKYGVNIYVNKKETLSNNLRCTIDYFEDYLRVAKVLSNIEDPVNVSTESLIDQLDALSQETRGSSAINRLILGTAQLGLNYGITNQTGKPSESHAKKIISNSVELGVKFFDTASVYGQSEKILGESSSLMNMYGANVITKLRNFPDSNCIFSQDEIIDHVDASVFKSCADLKKVKLHVLMLHQASYLTQFDGLIIKHLLRLKSDGYIENLGVSVQTPEELLVALSMDEISHIQMPFNILDWRWRNLEEEIERTRKARKVTVHVRSIFLQGLLLSSDQKIWKKVGADNPKEVINWMKCIVNNFEKKSIKELCVAFALSKNWIDGVVIGVETLEQLRENVEFFDGIKLTQDQVCMLENGRPKIPNNILNPALWMPH